MRDHALFLLVEDSEDDAFLLRQVFRKANINNPLQVVTSGEEAVAYLSGLGRYANRAGFPLPALVLLDLKMPGRMDGFEVLKWIRQQPALKTLPVVVLTGSNDPEDINRAYKLGANSFLTKPNDFHKFVEVTQALSGYWLCIGQPPGVSLPAPPLPEAESHPEPQMRVLLRSTETGLYFKAPGEWTTRPEEALDLQTKRAAINLAFQMGFKDVELSLAHPGLPSVTRPRSNRSNLSPPQHQE
ncbi:MAG TPA: response regulator [Candidatus Binatia bacterium]|jgi:CheY-like chemotaxis protein|nr:response regulator [Candidatus Binatia bacterium]